jgi:hypothetical protein
MSMNPAGTFVSAVPTQVWTGLWLNFAAPLSDMVPAGEVYLLSFGRVCRAEFHHDNDKRCISHHREEEGRDEPPVPGTFSAGPVGGVRRGSV